MKHLELFEPALDAVENYEMDTVEELDIVAAVFEAVEPLNEVKYNRYNLTSDPETFAKNPALSALLDEQGSEVLPVTMVDGVVKKIGAYPTVEEFGNFTDLMFYEEETECCGGHHHGHGEGCCGGHGEHHHGHNGKCCGGHGEHRHEEGESCCGGHHHCHE